MRLKQIVILLKQHIQKHSNMKYEYRLNLFYRDKRNQTGNRTVFITLDKKMKSIASYGELAESIAKEEGWDSCIISTDAFIRTVPFWERLLKKYATRDKI